ncbi:MAG: BrnT family toxin [Firmicutes bacterium]|nr:BrnT family toxin [Bacillota bacterium]
MDDLLFEWDVSKNERNVIKHGISFEEASTAFSDINALLFNDPDKQEQRVYYEHMFTGGKDERPLRH